MNFLRLRIVNGGLVFCGLMFACVALLATWKNNREIAERRFHDPVESVGTLLSAKCGNAPRGRSSANAVYAYSAQDGSQARHEFATSKWFEAMDDCREFIQTVGSATPIWYERSHPEQATFYPAEPDSWGFLALLFPSAIFFWYGVSAQPPRSKKRRNHRAR